MLLRLVRRHPFCSSWLRYSWLFKAVSAYSWSDLQDRLWAINACLTFNRRSSHTWGWSHFYLSQHRLSVCAFQPFMLQKRSPARYATSPWCYGPFFPSVRLVWMSCMVIYSLLIGEYLPLIMRALGQSAFNLLPISRHGIAWWRYLRDGLSQLATILPSYSGLLFQERAPWRSLADHVEQHVALGSLLFGHCSKKKQ